MTEKEKDMFLIGFEEGAKWNWDYEKQRLSEFLEVFYEQGHIPIQECSNEVGEEVLKNYMEEYPEGHN